MKSHQAQAHRRIRRLLCGSGGNAPVGGDGHLVGRIGHLQVFRSQVRRGVHGPAVQGRGASRYPGGRRRSCRRRTTRASPRCFRTARVGAHPGHADDRRATQFQCAILLRPRSGGLCDELPNDYDYGGIWGLAGFGVPVFANNRFPHGRPKAGFHAKFVARSSSGMGGRR